MHAVSVYTSSLLSAGQQVVMNLLCLTSYTSVCLETVS